MGNRGFPVVALSGELSQQERTHALQALRDGRARVCIATDVAARGIDLPGLDLVVHADLPTNPETLLHRSGRTGRAGAKGVSALIVTPAEFRKAQRLLQGARVVAEWGPAPSAAGGAGPRRRPHPRASRADRASRARTRRWPPALLDRFGPEGVAEAFVRLWREGRSAPEELADPAPRRPSGGPGAASRREHAAVRRRDLVRRCRSAGRGAPRRAGSCRRSARRAASPGTPSAPSACRPTRPSCRSPRPRPGASTTGRGRARAWRCAASPGEPSLERQERASAPAPRRPPVAAEGGGGAERSGWHPDVRPARPKATPAGPRADGAKPAKAGHRKGPKPPTGR